MSKRAPTECRCDRVRLLCGAEAAGYADAHLVLVEHARRVGGRELVYRCPERSWVWLGDHGGGDERGGGSLRLRRFAVEELPPAPRGDEPLDDREARMLLTTAVALDASRPPMADEPYVLNAFENVASSSELSRISAVRVLGEYAPAGAAAVVGRLLDDPSEEVMRAARDAVRRLASSPPDADAKLGLAWRGRTLDPVGDPVLAPWIATRGLEEGLHDYVDQNVPSATAIALSSLFWPSFAEIDGCFVLQPGPGARDVAAWLGLLHGGVSSDVWCPGGAPLEGCALCRSRIRGSFEKTSSGSPGRERRT